MWNSSLQFLIAQSLIERVFPNTGLARASPSRFIIFVPCSTPATFHANALTTCFVFRVFRLLFGRLHRHPTGRIPAAPRRCGPLRAVVRGLCCRDEKRGSPVRGWRPWVKHLKHETSTKHHCAATKSLEMTGCEGCVGAGSQGSQGFEQRVRTTTGLAAELTIPIELITTGEGRSRCVKREGDRFLADSRIRRSRPQCGPGTA